MKKLCSLMVVLVAITAMFGVSGIAKAATVDVDIIVDADADVREGSPDAAVGGRTWHYLCNTSTNSGKIYLRFALPEDFQSAVSASLNLTVGAVLSTSYASDVNIHGINDDVAGQDWTEYHSLTWNNAPGNDTTSDYQFSATDATDVLGSFNIQGGRYGAAVGDKYSVATQNLVDFINLDSDGIVTLALGRVGVSSAYHGIAAKEFGTAGYEPTLQLEYIAVPEPATMMLLGLGGLLLRRKK